MNFQAYECSSAQRRLFMLRQIAGNTTAYNLPRAMLVEGKVDINRFEESFKKLINRHEALRTSFEFKKGEIIQKIYDEVDFNIIYEDANGREYEEIIYDFIKPFDLNLAPLLRVKLVKVKEAIHLLLFDMDHIITDGVSVGILTKELISLYSSQELPPIDVQYVDFVMWQNDLLNSEEIIKQEKYWLEVFQGEIPVLNLPTDYSRTSEVGYRGSTILSEIDPVLTSKVREVASKNKATVFMFILAAYNILIAKYTNQDDICIGTPIAGRQHAELMNTIGIFINTLALRNYPAGNKRFIDFLGEVKDRSHKAYKNQDYQFEMLVEKLELQRDFSRNPLFDVMFVFQNTDNYEVAIEGLKFSPYYFEMNTVPFDLTIEGHDKYDQFYFNFEFSTSLFKAETIKRMINHFKNIIHCVAYNPQIKIADIDMLSQEEKEEILYAFNDTDVEFSLDQTIHQLFEMQVEKTPDQIAVVYENEYLTYRELNKKSNQLARLLREKGIKPNYVVGIMVERSLEMIIGIMGILKAGGAYLPIDPNYPLNRIQYMLQDSKTELLVTQSYLIDQIDFGGESITIDDEIYYGDTENLDHINQPTDLVYVIYTSGSTGRPKGVMVCHDNFVNSALGWRKEYQLDQIKVNLLQMASFSFDVFGGDLARSLLNGGKMVICPDSLRLDYSNLYDLIVKHQISLFEATPALVVPFMNYIYENQLNMDHLKLLILGSDSCKVEDFKCLLTRFGNQMRIINSYGVTEATIDTSYFETSLDKLSIGGNVPIGKPLPNMKMYILSQNLELKPIGVYGELYIGGAGVSNGYFDKAELTSERFIQDPFIVNVKDDISFKIMYKTGDIARWLPDGNIEFLGRADNQVKIRGYRIELGEIENHLLTLPEIKKAVVLDQKNEAGEKYLCAYIVSDTELTIVQLREQLSDALPDYMIPSHFAKIEQVPLTPNGKVDRRSLAELNEEIKTGTEFVAPENEIEKKLAEIWSEVLEIKEIGIHDNFFELGGHSLKATSFVTKVYKEFNVELPLREVFRTPTVKELAEFILRSEKNIYASIEPVKEASKYPVSSAQKRLYVLNQLEGLTTSYNMPGVVIIEGQLDYQQLEMAFQKLIKRHESLRTSFLLNQGELVQRVHKNIDFTIEYIKLENQQMDESEVEKVIKEFIRSFDLSSAPLLRVGLIGCNTQLKDVKKHLLIFDMHHIISDGISLDILVNDLMKLYEGKELADLRIQYKDFAVWQNALYKSDKFKSQEEYWLSIFNTDEEVPILNMPLDFTRPKVMSFEGEQFDFEISRSLTEDLNRLAKENGATLYMVLLGAYNILLSKYTGQEDIIVGSPIAGRHHPELEQIIGVFLNTLAMRNNPACEQNFVEFLGKVKENTLKALENQDYPFELLIEGINLLRDVSRNPLFDTMFSLQNYDNTEVTSTELRFIPYEFQKKSTQFDLQMIAVEEDQKLKFTFEYCTKLFKSSTIEKLAIHFIQLLENINNKPVEKLADLELLSLEEKDRLLNKFNNTIRVEYEKKAIHQLFEEQVNRTPEQIALTCDGQSLTYSELNQRANKLANFLKIRGVQRETIVGIMVTRSVDMIIAILSVLKAGGAYLPIDPDYPLERIEYLLRDSEAKIVLSESFLKNTINFAGEYIFLDQETFEEDPDNLININKASDMIYLIYTSGSTGKPKGTILEHCSVCNFIKGITEKIDFSVDKTILSLTTISFDIFILETLLPLVKGAKVVLGTELEQKDPQQMTELIIRNNINIVQLTPSRLQLCLENSNTHLALTKLEEILVGGEAFPYELFVRLQEMTTARIFNVYGPTETTVWSTIKELTTSKSVNIGKPIANTQIYILDDNLKLIPENVVGELYIAGDGLARGYFGRSELTEERFIENPFNVGTRMYKTGDLARWLSTGEIDFVGRRDQQVKLRGYRIETGEIEACLNNYAEIMESVVLVTETEEGEKYLVGYYVAEQEILVTDFRSHLSKTLPDYMIPEFYCFLKILPLTPNGKLDRKALPKIADIRQNLGQSASIQTPETELDKMIVEIWHEVLRIDQIGVNDNFFELGGNSILLVQMHTYLEKQVPGLLKITDLFAYPTIAKLSKYLEDQLKQRELEQERSNLLKKYWAEELKEPWLLVTLPGDYYHNGESFSNGSYLKTQIQGNTFKRLKQIALGEEIKIKDILISMYVYLLAELTQKKDIIINVSINEKFKNVVPLRINLEEIANLNELFKLVDKKYRKAEEMGTYPIRLNLNEKDTGLGILPLFCHQSNIGTNKSDLSLKYKEGKEDIILTCEYNNVKLKQSKVEELLHYYMSLLEMLVDEYFN